MHRFLFILLGLGFEVIQGRILLVDYSSSHSNGGDPCTLQIGTSKYRETTSEYCQGFGVLDLGTYAPSQVFLRHLNGHSSTPLSSFDLIDGFLWPFYPHFPSTSPSKISPTWQTSRGNLTAPSKMSLVIRSPSHAHVKVVVWCMGSSFTFDFDGLHTFECQKGTFSADVCLSGVVDFTKGDGYRGFYQVALCSQPLDSNGGAREFDSIMHQNIYSLDPLLLGVQSQVAIFV